MLAEKNKLRKQVKAFKDALTKEYAVMQSALIWRKLELLPQFINAKVVMLYWSFDKEVHTHDFIEKWAGKKEILLPVVSGNTMVLKPYTGIANMQKDQQFGIPEPQGHEFIELEKIDLIIVPGIAFDSKNYRMGRGKGYYDKFLSQIKASKIGVAFTFQCFISVPIEAHDIPMDLVINEE